MKNYDGNIIFEHCPHIVSYASVVGKKEGEGPLREYFDRIVHDSYAGKNTFEQAESELTRTAVKLALDKGRLTAEDVDLACCGDLLNQCVASSFAMRRFSIPYAGVYGACSTMALSMITAAIAAESGAVKRAVCAASSHYCTAERQYRFPLEYGSQRPPTAQWTVTGVGACIIESGSMTETGRQKASQNASLRSPEKQDDKRPSPPDDEPQILPTGEGHYEPVLHASRIGKIIDYNITDQNNMGAAMAPAVVKIGTKKNCFVKEG